MKEQLEMFNSLREKDIVVLKYEGNPFAAIGARLDIFLEAKDNM